MNSETKICQNCGNEFTIEPADFEFYEKMKVPSPTFCPECRRQRRLVWRNEATLYKRICDLCKKEIIGLYPIGTEFPVYCHSCWFSDGWDPLNLGKEYSFSVPFFEQVKELQKRTPRIAMFNVQSVNSDYTNQAYSNKNAYLSFVLRGCEDVAYIRRGIELKNCFDTIYTHHSELLYNSVDVDKSYQSRFLEESEGCVDSAFLSNCRNSQNCIGGVNLRSGSYIFFGNRLTKDQFNEKLKTIDWGSYSFQEDLKKDFESFKKGSIFRFAKIINCINCIGDHLNNAKNCYMVFDGGFELENTRYSAWVFNSKDVLDVYGMSGGNLFMNQ